MISQRLTIVLSIIVALAVVPVINTYAQDVDLKGHIAKSEHNWPSKSGMILASSAGSMEYDTWQDLDIYQISYFIDESIRDGRLKGYGSSSVSRERLNIMKNKIDNAETSLRNNSTFDETCQYLLDAHLLTDGLLEVPDILYGKARPNLAKMIEYMRIEIIGCQYLLQP